MRLHDDELEVDEPLVHRLLATQHPHLADLPLRALGGDGQASGSSNRLFRLGDDLLVRLPRQPGGSRALETERRWGPLVAAALPAGVDVPEVVASGRPGEGYPEVWSVTRWIEGTPPAVPALAPYAGSSGPLAHDLAEVLRGLWAAPVPAEAAADPALRGYRGGRLADLDEDLRETAAVCAALPGWADLGLDLDRVLVVWQSALVAEAALEVAGPVAEGWLHGDLLAENLLVREGRLAAVLDLGGLGVGRRAVDLVVAWEVLDAPGRALLRELLDIDEATWRVGQGWALLLALITFPFYGRTMPARCAARRAMAAAVLDTVLDAVSDAVVDVGPVVGPG